MKFRVSRENIEFYFDEKEALVVITAIHKVLVPKHTTQLYFHTDLELTDKGMDSLKKQGLVVLSDDNNSTLLKKQRVLLYKEMAVLVPVLSGMVQKSVWQPICQNIMAECSAAL
ncbi:hypothetical protein QWI17_03805 [Gilvimarinus sp. SDUM040013]|uniref:Uncharacterized protein n=1 Tax=Gilvimarinus gilvus TaxID=3058038 RepID=A0ABU4S2T8_9GAMM|nr:hypothetical protein [Gilvimarinus sp. SDUM040013]MDO3384963.1 hypothetical protein [Gilvimarinus sp. SDUM040013]MDX6851489.1 hypothetical protein [Gilvimarinus sp. SDUM040013]